MSSCGCTTPRRRSFFSPFFFFSFSFSLRFFYDKQASRECSPPPRLARTPASSTEKWSFTSGDRAPTDFFSFSSSSSCFVFPLTDFFFPSAERFLFFVVVFYRSPWLPFFFCVDCTFDLKMGRSCLGPPETVPSASEVPTGTVPQPSVNSY